MVGAWIGASCQGRVGDRKTRTHSVIKVSWRLRAGLCAACGIAPKQIRDSIKKAKNILNFSLAKIRLIGSTEIGQSNSSNSVSVFYGHRLDRLGRVPPQHRWCWGLYNGPFGASTSQLGFERDLIEVSNQLLERANW